MKERNPDTERKKEETGHGERLGERERQRLIQGGPQTAERQRRVSGTGKGVQGRATVTEKTEKDQQGRTRASVNIC